MLGWPRSAGLISGLAVAAITGIAAGAWHALGPADMTLDPAAQLSPGGILAPAAPLPDTSSAPALPPPVATLAPEPPPAAPGALGEASKLIGPSPPQQAQGGHQPIFDVVRVEPTGESVIAGRAEPGASVALMDGGEVLAEMKADASGQFAIVPKAFAPGDHLLTLRMIPAQGEAIASGQSVTVAVPEKGGSEVLVALTAPDKPTVVLSGQNPAPQSSAPAQAPATRLDTARTSPSASDATPAMGGGQTPRVAIRTVEAEEAGSFFSSGAAPASALIRLYLNGSLVASAVAGQDGRWSLKIRRGMRPGSYAVRADEVDRRTGKVISRAEVPFDYPAPAAAAAGRVVLHEKSAESLGSPASRSGSPGAPASGPAGSRSASADLPPAGSQPASQAAPSPAQAAAAAAGANVVVGQIQTATVTRGDSLWRISRKVLGRGIRYTQIYTANSAQIRNPSLIYPGQIFVLPRISVD